MYIVAARLRIQSRWSRFFPETFPGVLMIIHQSFIAISMHIWNKQTMKERNMYSSLYVYRFI